MREPEARSYNTTAGRVGAARRQAGATGRSSRREPKAQAMSKARRDWRRSERERLVAAAEGCVCVGRERARAMSKPERLATLCSFPNTSAGLRTLPSPNAEPVPSLFIPSQNQYYNQRRESRQEKPLLSLTRFLCLLSFS